MNESLQKTLLSVCQRNGLKELYERIDKIRPESIQVRVAFLGEFNAGKTTLVNALIRRKLLPMFDIPTTSVVTEISAGSEDKVFTATLNEEAEWVEKEIRFSELADECMKVEPNKKIVLKLTGLDFLPPKTLLIDTPGLASIEKMHTDITIGYLPLVDIALLVINPVAGDIPESLLSFLKQLSPDLLDKIHFIISRADELSEEASAAIKNKIAASLGKIVKDPQLLLISGKTALDALGTKTELNEELYEASGIGQLVNIIRDDIPRYKEFVEQKRVRELLLKAKSELQELLTLKLSSLNWDLGTFNTKISQYRSDISVIEEEIRQFKNKFQDIQQKTIAGIGQIVDEYSSAISFKIAREESFDGLIRSMVSEVQQKIELGMSEMKLIRFQAQEHGQVEITEILQALIEKEAAAIKDIADLITDAATFAMTVWIVPGSSAAVSAGEALAGTGVVLVQEADNGNPQPQRSEKNSFIKSVGKVLGAAGNLIKRINPLEKIKTLILPHVVNPKLRIVMKGKVLATVNQVYTILGVSLSEELEEKYLVRLKDKKQLLEETEELKKTHAGNVNTERDQLQKEIDTITEKKLLHG